MVTNEQSTTPPVTVRDEQEHESPARAAGDLVDGVAELAVVKLRAAVEVSAGHGARWASAVVLAGRGLVGGRVDRSGSRGEHPDVHLNPAHTKCAFETMMRLNMSPASFIADLHIHSYLSRATSKQCDLPHLALWAQRKGIRLLATGDFTHPEWFARIEDELVPQGNGLFRLRPDLAREVGAQVPSACQAPVDFVLQVEISSIYKRGDKVRKVHNLVYLPDLDAARRLCEALGRIGNIRSDGRPILGLDSRDLLEIVLECSDRGYLIPAHVWTPWFSVFGSKSGFDTLAECYDDLTDHIFALETGLSSDPPMNWRLSQLDGLTLVSNSDAHSPSKLGREANLFHTEMSYDAVFAALKDGDPTRYGGTLEFYPEEGKYHLDGCRKCGVRLEPEQTRELGGRCPECGKLITVGVMSRVEELADREPGARPDLAAGFESLIPLQEVLGRCFDQGPATKRVFREYDRLLAELGPELEILRSLPVDALRGSASPLLGEAVRRMRAGELHIAAGYDGEFGKVELFGADERQRLLGQADLFPMPAPASVAPASAEKASPTAAADRTAVLEVEPCGDPEGQLGLFGAEASTSPRRPTVSPESPTPFQESPLLAELTAEQRAAVCHTGSPLLIVAGPGTGKTRTLTRRLAYLIRETGVAPDRVLAVTFTNRAAGEMRERLAALLDTAAAGRVCVSTFHGLGLELLRRHADVLGLDPGFAVLDEWSAAEAYALALGEAPSKALRKRVQAIGTAKLRQGDAAASDSGVLAGDLERYAAALQKRGAVDYADLIVRPVALLASQPDLAAQERARWACIAVDEYQDIDPRQRELLAHLTGPDTDLCAIGDPDQSIYGFRGADVSLFAAFEQDYEDVRRAALGQSFRSTAPILALAAEVVRHAPDFGRVRVEPAPSASAGSQDPVALTLFASVEAEAAEVAHRIEELVGGVRSLTDASDHDWEGGASFSDVAVLARTGARLDAVAEALGRVGIPTERVGVEPVDAAEEALLLALLRLFAGQDSPADLLRLLRHHGAQRKHLTGLSAELASGAVGEALRAGEGIPGVGSSARAALEKLQQQLSRFSAELADDPTGAQALASAAAVLELGWPPDPGSRALSWIWAAAAEETTTLGLLLDRRAMQTPPDTYEARAERVALLTIHAAKGLEFDAVFIVGCEDGTLPWIVGDNGDPESPHEERRLLYVGMTRARRHLWLGASRRVRRFGQTHKTPPSRFLQPVSPTLLKVKEHRPPRRIRQHQLDLG